MRKVCVLLLCFFLAVPVSASADERPRYIALTFDDGPSGRYTRRLLEGLEERDAHATFFLCGYRMAQDPELAGRIVSAGHEIGLHGYSHKSMRELSRRQIAAELEDTRALLPEGCNPVWLRPPGGCCSDGVRQVAEVTGLAILDWSLDPQDWATRDITAVKRSILSAARDGDVVLLHDMTDSSVDAALAVIDSLQDRGFRFVTVSEMVRRRRVSIEPGKTYRCFPPKD